MPWYIGDYLRDTAHLEAHEHGGYMLMLAHAWQHDGALPLDPERIRKIARLSPEQWTNSGPTLMEFWQKNGTAYRQKRTDQELERAKTSYQQKVDAGKASAAKRSFNGRSTDAARTLNESESESESDLDSDSKKPKPLARASRLPTPQKAAKQVNRGTRLPSDWRIPNEWVDLALAIRTDWTRPGVIRESITFRDYWWAKAGKDAVKMSWLATWRNWIRRAEHEPVR